MGHAPRTATGGELQGSNGQSLCVGATARKLSGHRPLAIFAGTDLDGLASGSLAAAAPLYADALPGAEHLETEGFDPPNEMRLEIQQARGDGIRPGF